MADNDDNDAPRAEILEPAPQRLPNLPLPPSGIFRTTITTIIKYGGVRKAYESYEKALAARRDALAAYAGMQDAETELYRATQRLEDLGTILATDAAERAEARASAEVEHEIGKLRRERELIEETMKLATAREKFGKTEGRQSGSDEADEIVETYTEELNRKLYTPQKIREATEALINERIKERGGEDSLKDEDQAWIRQVRAFEEEYLSDISGT